MKVLEKKTFQEFEKERADAAAALKNLVGSVEKRTELEKKVDLSKCFEADKIDTKLNPVKQPPKVQKANKSKAAKVVDFNELKKEQGVLSNANSQQRNNRSGPNRNVKINNSQNQFPSLGEEPSQNYSRNENWSNNSQRQQNKPPRQQGQNQGQGQTQGTQGTQQPRAQGQGQGQRQGQKQGQGNQQNRGNNNQGQNKNFNNRNNSSQQQGQGVNSV